MTSLINQITTTTSGPATLRLRAVAKVIFAVHGIPMYNFGIATSLKQWIEAICRAGVILNTLDRAR